MIELGEGGTAGGGTEEPSGVRGGARNRGRRVGFCKFWLCPVAKEEGEMLF